MRHYSLLKTTTIILASGLALYLYSINTYVFPLRPAGVPFPKNFLSMAKTILKRLFRVYAHIYHQHFPEVVQLGEEAHLNTSFKHFIFFVQVSYSERFYLNKLLESIKN